MRLIELRNTKDLTLMSNIIIKGLTHNNLKNISFKIPKNKIVVFTGTT